MGKLIKVLLCDDHALLRSGIKALIDAEPDLQVVGEVGSGEQALESLVATSPDVILMDVSLPGIDGLETARKISEEHPECRVLIVTMHRQVFYLLKALQVGASGYVLKSDLGTELLGAIRETAHDRAFVYSADTWVFFEAYLAQGGDPGTRYLLSTMEQKVLEMTATGHTSREIAERLFISTSTVDTYRSRIMNKLGVESRSDLVQWAWDHGMFAMKQYN